MASEPHDADRHDFLKRLAAATVYTPPLVAALGASAAEQRETPFQKTKRFLNQGRNLIVRARRASEGKRKLAMEASEAVTEARKVASELPRAERERLKTEFEKIEGEVRRLMAETD